MTATRPAPELLTTLPGAYYYDPAIYAREQARIFGELWVCAGRADDIPAPGDYATAEVGGESVLVARSGDGRLRAFLNVCRHRGARLCPVERGRVAGAFQCRYHAWTYGLDGRLTGAPNLPAVDGFDRDAFGLHPVALEVWEGLIWLCLAETPAPLAEQLDAPILARFGERARFDRYRLGDLKVGRTIEYDVQANWKIVVENFMECYHCGPVHPEFCRLLPDFRSGQSYQNQVGVGTAFADEIDAFTVTGQGRRARLPGLLPEDDRLYYGLTLLPNVLLSLLPDHIIMHTARPEGPTRTRVVCDWLFDAGAVAAPDFDPDDAVAVFDLVNRQDWEVCALAQQGMASRAYRSGGVYAPSERHLRDFNDFVRARLA
jgi:Rieske 2Fe-2S family protein